MEEPVISIIVPIYNVEKYLAKCIDSILKQTFTNFELILVDDGSPDKCPRIIDEYKKIDKRIKVIHKKNGGLSAARNSGYAISKGKYIGFVDSDDWIAEDFYQTLYEDIIMFDADISIVSMYKVLGDSIKAFCDNGEIFVLNPEEALKLVLEAKLSDVGVQFRLYNRKIFNNKKIFLEGKINEDALATYEFFRAAEKIVFHGVPKYYYLIRESSIDNSIFNPKKLQYIELWEIVLESINIEYPRLSGNCLHRITYNCLSILKQFLTEEGTFYKYANEYIVIIEYMRKFWPDIRKSPNIPILWKLLTRIAISRPFKMAMQFKRKSLPTI